MSKIVLMGNTVGESFDSAERRKFTPFMSKITHPMSKIAISFYSDAS